jgi:hypothetical protein
MVTVLYFRAYSPTESRQNLVAQKIGFLYLLTYGSCLLGELSVVVQVGHRVDRVLSFLSSRPNWGSPTPSHIGDCVPLPLLVPG